MRSLLISLVVFGAIPFILTHPYAGVLIWSWISYMNPHRLSYGFSYDFPFAAVIGSVTLVAIVFSKEPKRIPWNAVTVTWLLLVLWMNVTTLFALVPQNAMEQWERTMKIMLMSFVSLMIMGRRERLQMLVWVIVVSIGFYGVKGGLFTLLTGGEYYVWGPPRSFIGDNNSLGLALVMTIPFMRYLQQTTKNRLVRTALVVAMILMVAAVVGTRSRGAFLAASAMGFMLWYKSARKMLSGMAVALIAAAVLVYAPGEWTERMETIKHYQQDASAMGRINAWWFAVNLATDHPLVGGGFDSFEPELFQRYAPVPDDYHDSHSIYFQMLGHHGFVGLILFLILGFLSFRTAAWVMRNTKDIPDLHWARALTANAQASLAGFAVGGAFLGLAYFDLYYHIVAIVLLTRVLVEAHRRDSSALEVQGRTDDRVVAS